MRKKVLFCLPFLLLLHVSYAQIKTVAATGTGEVTIHWRGTDTARIQIGKHFFSSKANEEHALQLPVSTPLTVQVKTTTGPHSADHYLTVQEGKSYVSIDLKEDELIVQQSAGSKLKSGVDEIAANMQLVTGGTFQMGSNLGAPNEHPVHTVRLNSFYISKYEVTQEQWQEVMHTEPGYFKNCPVCAIENISWNDAQLFISRLNQLTVKHYRLPTEAEWEYAARGGNETAKFTYSGSNTLSDVAWYSSNGQKQTHPVGTKMPNELGLYDMTGNVWEWCNDWYGETYYATSPIDNPTGPKIGELHILRGGSWFDFDIESRTTYRFSPLSDYRMYILGFRLAMDEK